MAERKQRRPYSKDPEIQLQKLESARKRYLKTKKGKEALKRQVKTEAAHKARAKYRKSQANKAVQIRYQKSPLGQATLARRQAKINLFKRCEEWLKQNPGKTATDFFNLPPKEN